jgi:uncharacterized linocin/CFP29 family protein
MNLGRDKLPWTQEVWDRMDQAVHAEAQRAKVAAKFLPLHGPIGEALTVPADTIDPGEMTVEEGAVTPVVEMWVEFRLTKPQVEGEEELKTAVTLATRATNLLAQAEDLLIFQGPNAVDPVDKELVKGLGGNVRLRNTPDNRLAWLLSAKQAQPVPPKALGPGGTPRYSENTASAVAHAYGDLQHGGDYGPYALVLQTVPYADTFAPLANTLIMPADRIKPLVTAGFHGTGTLPASTGVLVSLGGNTMDLVVGVAPTTAVMQEDSKGMWRLRVFERFALRLKKESAVIRLEFLPATAEDELLDLSAEDIEAGKAVESAAAGRRTSSRSSQRVGSAATGGRAGSRSNRRGQRK